MTQKRKGELTEYKIIAKLMELGYWPSIPVGDSLPYDLVLDIKGKLYKCQCKTARIKKDCIEFNTSSSRMNTKKIYRTNYHGLIDYFLVYLI